MCEAARIVFSIGDRKFLRLLIPKTTWKGVDYKEKQHCLMMGTPEGHLATGLLVFLKNTPFRTPAVSSSEEQESSVPSNAVEDSSNKESSKDIVKKDGLSHAEEEDKGLMIVSENVQRVFDLEKDFLLTGDVVALGMAALWYFATLSRDDCGGTDVLKAVARLPDYILKRWLRCFNLDVMAHFWNLEREQQKVLGEEPAKNMEFWWQFFRNGAMPVLSDPKNEKASTTFPVLLGLASLLLHTNPALCGTEWFTACTFHRVWTYLLRTVEVKDFVVLKSEVDFHYQVVQKLSSLTRSVHFRPDGTEAKQALQYWLMIPQTAGPSEWWPFYAPSKVGPLKDYASVEWGLVQPFFRQDPFLERLCLFFTKYAEIGGVVEALQIDPLMWSE